MNNLFINLDEDMPSAQNAQKPPWVALLQGVFLALVIWRLC